jgi:ribosomal protein L37AE/L43A
MARRVISLKYPATCADCGADLEVGDEARYYGRGRVYGVACHDRDRTASDAPARPRNSTTCPTCKRPGALSRREAAKGYQCNACADAEEGPNPYGHRQSWQGQPPGFVRGDLGWYLVLAGMAVSALAHLFV